MATVVVQDEASYDDSNRAFLQAFMTRSSLTFNEARPILAAILSARDRQERLVGDVTEADFNAYISAANTAVSAYDMEIRSDYHQQTRAHVYALVNVASDAMSQIATTFTADEIGWLKRVLDTMFETNNTRRHEVMAIKSMDAIRLNRPSTRHRDTMNGSESQVAKEQGITMVQAEEMLKTLVDQAWFEKSQKGYYSLSPRALMELRGWLIETYNDPDDEGDGDDGDQVTRIKLCHACKGIVTVGQRCSKLACNCRIHDICTESLFRMQRSRQCPVCKSDWTGNDFVGERADLALAKNRNSNASRPTPRRTQQVPAENPPDADNEVDQEAGPEDDSHLHDDLYDAD